MIKAAGKLNVAPWELELQPTYWRDRALIVENAESIARRKLQDRDDQMNESRKRYSK